MKRNKIEKQKFKNSHNEGINPSKDNLEKFFFVLEINFKANENGMYDDGCSIDKRRNDADKKERIVISPYAIIEPHTMMVKSISASITRSAVLTISQTVTVTELAKEDFIIFW